MFNIYQWFYKNVWPLKNKSILINYKQWKTIIQGPIGTGKSFLFFDGPLFSLYKNIDRTIINKNSKSSQTQLLFSINENYYLIIRNIKITKTWKDSVKTNFYSIKKDQNFVNYLDGMKQKNIILENNDIFTLLNFYQVYLEDLTPDFKQETELQNNLNDLLPSKEVVMSTIFIPQDSVNIFEIESSKRIEILKKFFWILGIDDAKKIIDKQKQEIFWMIKAKEDFETYKLKFKKLIRLIRENTDKLKNIEQIQNLLWEDIFNFEEDFEINLDKINKIQIDTELIRQKNNNKIENYLKNNENYNFLYKSLKKEEENKQKLLNKKDKIQKQTMETKKLEEEKTEQLNKMNKHQKKWEENEAKIKNIQSKYDNLQKQYELYLKIINELDNKKNNLKSIEEQKKQTQDKITQINSKLNKINIKDYEEINKQIKKIEEESKLTINFNDFNVWEYQITKESEIEKIKELESIFTKIETNWKNLKSQIEQKKQQKEDFEKEFENIKTKILNKWNIDFFCKKINKNCPFTQDISQKLNNQDNYFYQQQENLKSKITQLWKEIEKLDNQKQTLANYRKNKNIKNIKEKIKNYYNGKEKIKELQSKINEKQKQQNEIATLQWQQENFKEHLNKLKKEIKKTNQEIENLELNKKENDIIKKDYDDYLTFQKEQINLNKESNKFKNELENIQNKEKSIEKLKIEEKNIDENLKSQTENVNKIRWKLEKFKEKIQDKNIEELKDIDKKILKLQENITNFNNLVEDVNNNKIQLLKLKKKYNLLKNLSKIFGQELIIYVFHDYLELLENLINYFLDTIVEFKLKMQLDQKSENLDIIIKDNKWERNVKSLSWWQKNALKIWWILWINKLKNSKLLFLDETINNFDVETINLVAEKIKEFVNQNNMKFYMITHSEILEQINIWDQKINLKV